MIHVTKPFRGLGPLSWLTLLIMSVDQPEAGLNEGFLSSRHRFAQGGGQKWLSLHNWVMNTGYYVISCRLIFFMQLIIKVVWDIFSFDSRIVIEALISKIKLIKIYNRLLTLTLIFFPIENFHKFNHFRWRWCPWRRWILVYLLD